MFISLMNRISDIIFFIGLNMIKIYKLVQNEELKITQKVYFHQENIKKEEGIIKEKNEGNKYEK